MRFQYKIYAILLLSFTILIFSLSLSYKNIQDNNKVLNYLNKEHIQLTNITSQLNYYLKNNQALLLQYLLIQKEIAKEEILAKFHTIDTSIKQLKHFTQTHPDLPDEFQRLLTVVEKRIYAYKIIEQSVIDAMKNQDKEDLYDAIIGFNDVTKKFALDTQKLTDLANTILHKKIATLEANNKKSSLTLLLSFFTAFLLIAFSIYKFNRLRHDLKVQLIRAHKAEDDLKKAQEDLLRYNENLENEILKKTAEIQKKIYTHSISGLPNRNQLREDMDRYSFTKMALLNIDKFQSFNDIYGEEMGNVALKLTGEFLQEAIDGLAAKLYHIGGDEFVVVCIDTQSDNRENFIAMVTELLKSYKKHKFLYHEKIFQFMMSSGITFTGTNKMLAYADMALKDAKKRNIQLAIFQEDKTLEKRYKNDIACHKKLISALERNAVISYFQPIVPIQDPNKPTKYESLVRIKDEDGTIIPPFNFLDVAKANRIYYKITRSVIANTLSVIHTYKVPCSINLSLVDIANKRTMESFFAQLDNFEENDLLTVELLETEDFQDYEMVYDFCMRIRSYGITISLDDFGSGYSNFSHILQLPVDYIKIDASLISNIDRNSNSKVMVETIVGLAKKLNVATIAEFVSSEAILQTVKSLGVDYAQGFHLGKPQDIGHYLKAPKD